MYGLDTINQLNAVKQDNKQLLTRDVPSVFGANGQPKFVPSATKGEIKAG